MADVAMSAADEADPVARAAALAPLIGAAATRVEATRRLDEAVLAALREAGLFRLLMPRWLGGAEAPPSVFIEVVEAVAAADASTAWCLCQMSVCSIASVYLAPAAAREVFGQQGGGLAWGTPANARAVKVHGGYRVSGDWDFGSGCHHATWLGAHCPVVREDGSPLHDESGRPMDRTLLVPKAAVRITDVWHVLGLRGTGSDRYSLDGLFVPEEHAILALMNWPDASRLALAAPYRFAANNLYAAGFAAVGLGNARGALDTFVALARGKVPRWGRAQLRDDVVVQVAVGEADTELRSARTNLVQTVREAETAAMRQGGLSLDQRMRIRAAGTFGIRTASRVVDRLYELAGTTAIFDDHPFERRFRDARTVSQHLQGRIGHFETIGKHLLGIEPDTRFV